MKIRTWFVQLPSGNVEEVRGGKVEFGPGGTLVIATEDDLIVAYATGEWKTVVQGEE